MSRRRKAPRGNPAASSESTSGGSDADRRSRPRPRLIGGGRILAEANPRAGDDPKSNPKLLVYALLGTTVFLFCYLHLLALPQMTQFTGGFSMPDSLLTGYDVSDIERLRSVMDEDALGQLNFVHKTAGILFPVSFFLTAWAVVGLMMREGVVRWLLLAAAGLFTAMDITENFLIDQILSAETVDAGTVNTSSALTVSSWLLFAVVGSLLIIAVIMAMVRRSVERTARPL
ncbi:hypothetical protein [Nesterenkonia xinjiangensis]|uniref:Uncharacterized protein n=1 Tax=Nesterenkonia xinjiangensis TaxID=225327 RepID=A0A7Z0GKE2_9MICC|nr:hypothetical protein [Nesterenkonia xinjiangensis]NYJ77562.1 hypothetical protein [Nesterenkonia xinjiangensis]